MGMSITFHGRRAYERRMRRAGREVRKEMRSRLRTGAKILRTETRKRAKAAYPGGRGTLARAIRFKVRVRRDIANAWVGISASTRANRRKPTGLGYSIPSAYGPVLQRGGAVRRKRGRRTARRARRAHTAYYQAKPFQVPAVNATKSKIMKEIGATFKVV